MRGGLPWKIARRYLFSKKSHSAVSAISAVSMVGVAVATAALVCVLSVFNGYRDVLADKLDLLGCDVAITPAKGKTIDNADSLINVISATAGVEMAMPVVSDNALALYNAHELPVSVKGVDAKKYFAMTAIKDIVITGDGASIGSSDGAGELDEYGLPTETRNSDGIVAVGVASRLGIYQMGDRLTLFTPRKGARVNPANPLASFVVDSIAVTGVYQTMQQEYDDNMVLTDLEVARHLFGYSDQATSIEIKAKGNAANLAERLRETLPATLIIKDRLQQQEVNYRMIKIEKWVTFLLLFFILLIAGFNLISTLSMLVLEKKSSLRTFHSMGMTVRDVGNIFACESVYVTAIGGLSGIVLGVVLCLLQEQFGWIKLNADPDTLVIDAYPVAVEWTDILVVMIPIVIIGALTALLTAAFARRRLRS